MKKVFFALGALFTLLLLASGLALFLQYSSVKNEEVLPPDMAEFQAPEAPVGDADSSTGVPGSEPALSQPGE